MPLLIDHDGVGYYTLHWIVADLYDVTLWHLGCHGAMWAYMLTVDITCPYRVLWLASEVWRGPVGSVMSRGSDRLCEFGDRFWSERYDFVSYAINGVNRQDEQIKLIRVRVEGFMYIRGCVLQYTIDWCGIDNLYHKWCWKDLESGARARSRSSESSDCELSVWLCGQCIYIYEWKRSDLLINDLTVLRSFWLFFPAHPLQFGACDQDCVPAEHAWRWITSGKWQKNMDSIRSIPKSFRQDEPMIGLKTALGRNPLRVDRTGDASRTRVSVTCKTTGSGGQMTVGWNRTHSPRIQYSRRVVNAEQEIGQLWSEYQTEQFSGGTISGVSHGSVHYSYRTDQIARRLVVTFWRATMIGLRRKDILTCIAPDGHMMCMWRRNYVLRVNIWKKQWSGF